jgi:hypothetical protein
MFADRAIALMYPPATLVAAHCPLGDLAPHEAENLPEGELPRVHLVGEAVALAISTSKGEILDCDI